MIGLEKELDRWRTDAFVWQCDAWTDPIFATGAQEQRRSCSISPTDFLLLPFS